MPKLPPSRNTIFNAAYEALSTMKSDGFTVPHYNSSATLSIYPGEPFLKHQGTDPIVVIAQSEIPPGEWRSVVRFFDAVFPCDFSANVKDGDAVWWDIDDEVCKLEGDVENGFLLGNATYSVEPGQKITAVANDRNIVATATSTHVQVVNTMGISTVIGEVGSFDEIVDSE